MGEPIKDDERLYVVYTWKNYYHNSDRNVAEITGISKKRVEQILSDHLSGKHRVEYVEIESKMNNEITDSKTNTARKPKRPGVLQE